jgi:hypothetical protein
MSKSIKFYIVLFVALSFARPSQASIPNRTGFFGGAGGLVHSDFYIFTKWGGYHIDKSAFSPHIVLGYIHRFAPEKLGLSITCGASWFKNLPDFGIELFPDAPAENSDIINYSSVKFALYTADLSLVMFSERRFEYDIGFTLGVQSNSEVRYELEYSIANPFHPQKYRIKEGEAFVVAGATIGITYSLSNHLFCTTRGRLIVGEHSSSGYALYINGQKMGDPYGKTSYMKQIAVVLIYRL